MERNCGTQWHPLAEELLDYFEHKLSEEAEKRFEEHFTACTPCAELGREAYAFDQLCSWSARAEGVLHARLALSQALATAQAQAPTPGVAQRLLGWQLRYRDRAEAALSFVTRAARGTYEVVGRGVDELSRAASPWRFVLEPATVAVRGVEPEAPDAVTLTASAPAQRRRATVAIQGGENSTVVARVDGVSADDRAPLVLLFSAEPGTALRCWVQEARRVRGADYSLAEFEEVPAGEYIVAFEPASGSAASGIVQSGG